MFPCWILLLILETAAVHGGQVVIQEATARSIYQSNPTVHGPNNAIDGDTSTDYHSSEDNQPEWLKLTLDRAQFVDKVVIINRYDSR